MMDDTFTHLHQLDAAPRKADSSSARNQREVVLTRIFATEDRKYWPGRPGHLRLRARLVVKLFGAVDSRLRDTPHGAQIR